jgi:hypothetical protein
MIVPFVITKQLVTFDKEKLFEFLCEKYGILAIIRMIGHAMLAFTLDRARLSWFRSFVMAGTKFVDANMLNPLTGNKLFGETGDVDLQTLKACVMWKIVISKDCKALYEEEFREMFEFFNQKVAEYTNEQGKQGLIMLYPQDLCSVWKTCGREGACKVKKFSCYCCMVTTEQLVVPNKERCNWCIEEGNCECYH